MAVPYNGALQQNLDPASPSDRAKRLSASRAAELWRYVAISWSPNSTP